jgi:cell division protein FtsB
VNKLMLALLLLVVYLQYRLWVGDGSLEEVWRLHGEVERQQVENAVLRERNNALDAEVLDLKQGLDAIEERAREELGMIKRQETFYEVIED